MTRLTPVLDMWKVVVYDMLILACLPFLAVRYAFKRRLKGFGRRFLFFPGIPGAGSFIWLHAVSVGEVVALGGIVEFLREHFSSLPLFITTVTPSGLKVARDNFSTLAEVELLPLDLSFFSRRMVKMLRPRIFIAVETEIWPNLFYFLKKSGVPVVIVNGRISDKSFIRYQIVKRFMRRYFSMIDFVFAKDTLSRRRFISLGVETRKTAVMGNIKFIRPRLDSTKAAAAQTVCARLKGRQALLLLAASTHFPEEEAVVKTFARLRRDYPGLKMIICPRHVERSGDILAVAQAAGYKAVCLSRGKVEGADIVILDRIGELIYFYPCADIVFMGGSLAPVGGHNIIEPAFFGRPVVFGPYMHNFSAEKSLFLGKKAAWEINSEDELAEALNRLISQPQLRFELGRNAQAVVETEAGRLRESLMQLKRWVK